MISISHSPNSDWQQQKLAMSLLLPWNWNKWKSGAASEQLKKQLSSMHDERSISLFKNGRSALYAILKALEIQSGDEVIIQAYTCIVVPNSVIWAGAKPIYIDIDESFNIDPRLIEKAITPKTKAIIVQHTFGYPAQMNAIVELAKKHNIKVIEDCAHSLGAKYNNQLVGTFGDAAILSFGRDKMISSVSGGATITSSTELAKKLEELSTTALENSVFSIFQNSIHPLLIPWMARLIGPLKIGQLLIFIAQKTKLLNKVYLKNECNGQQPKELIQPLPNAMALFASKQLLHLEENLKKRREHAFAYQEFCSTHSIPTQQIHINSEPSYLRFTIKHGKPNQVRSDFRKQGFLLGNWYSSTIMPRPDNWSSIYYTEGSCPKSEELVKQNINLPTQRKLSMASRSKLLKLLKNYYE